MTVLEFLSDLRRLDIRVSAAGDRLRVSAPEGTLTEELRSELAARKGEILTFLQETAVRQPSIPRVSRDGVLPLSFAQERMWFLAQLEPDSSAYNLLTALRLSGQLDLKALEKSLNEVVRRHEVLRTSFPAVNGLPEQVISQSQDCVLHVVDLSPLSQTKQPAEVQKLASQEANRPFNLSTGPLLRPSLFRLGEGEHVLLLVMHHITADAWSRGIMRRELEALYEAFQAGEPSPLPELPIQYADFAVWQRSWLADGTLIRQLDYWLQQLGGAPVLELGTDSPRPPRPTYRGDGQRIVLPVDLMKALRALSLEEGTTLFVTLLAAFQTLLYRYTGQDDLCVGTPIANRRQRELEELIGFFVNTLVMRCDLSGNPTFRELLRTVREVALEAYANQDAPFERVVEELQPERDPSVNPLFQVMFALQNARQHKVSLSGTTTQPFTVKTSTTRHDLAVHMFEAQSGLMGRFRYRTDLFAASTIKRMMGHFENLLNGIVADPDQRISRLPLLTTSELDEILVTWNQAPNGPSEDPCLHHLVERQAANRPDAIAVVAEGQQLTYRQLNERANQVACHLRDLGIGPETPVGLIADRSAEMILGLLGVLKAGGAFVPLDPAAPVARLQMIAQDTGTRVLLATSKSPPTWSMQDTEVVYTDVGPWAAHDTAPNPTPVAGEYNAAYILYTSGSTGRPKGVVVEHRQLASYVYSAVRQYGMAEGGAYAMVQPLTFDSCHTMLFPALGWGGTLHLISRERALDAVALEDYFHRHQIDFLKIAPSHMHALMSGEEPEKLLPRRCLIVGGEASHWQFIDQLLALEPACAIWNHYGPTETTVGVLTYPVSARGTEHRRAAASVPLGRPLQGVRAYILDQHGNPVPIGQAGELCIGGPFVARGYLNRSEETAARFQQDPFSDDPSARLYWTGDLVRYLPDGVIEFLGRTDHQVKIRGHRVELGEIEAVLTRHPAVLKVTAHVREDERGEDWLVAYVVGQGTEMVNIDNLRRFSLQRLPDYMVPSAFAAIDDLPLLPSGKVDRHALPMPDFGERRDAFVAPRTSTEKALAQIWSQILRLERIGVNDNFFDLGGHSLLGVRLVTLINKKLETGFPLAALFQAPTIEEMAHILDQKEQGIPTTWSPLVSMQTTGSRPPLFVVPGNVGNVFTDLGDLARYFGPDQPFYGLQDGPQNPVRIEAVAGRYMEEIRRVRSEGPYMLAGVCSGAAIAFDMARRLRAQGQEVLLLAMIEPNSPSEPGPRTYLRFVKSQFRRYRRRLGHHAREMRQLAPAEQGEYSRLKFKVLANRWALSRYAPKPYPGRIDMFLTEASLRRVHNRQQAWREFAMSGMQVHEIPGSHATIVGLYDTLIDEAHMQVLAEKMNACISETLSDDRMGGQTKQMDRA